MHSHHSHSGDFISHAQDSLDDVVSLAAKKGFDVYCLTEHMPRLDHKFLYPEEIDKRYTIDDLEGKFAQYLDKAYSLQQKYLATLEMQILVGFEVEGIDDPHIDRAMSILQSDRRINMSVGSVHYVNQIPIDFNQDLWIQARDSVSGKTSRALYSAYFELQYKVIQRVHPTVIGHFDLIRLFQPHDELDPTTGKQISQLCIATDWPEVWALIVRNIEYAASYGALFELNAAAIRKGWDGPYPKSDICTAIKEHGRSRFCLSDDSHGLAQVGLNYHKTWSYIRDELNLDRIFYLSLDAVGNVDVKLNLVLDLDKSEFWSKYE